MNFKLQQEGFYKKCEEQLCPICENKMVYLTVGGGIKEICAAKMRLSRAGYCKNYLGKHVRYK